MCKATRESGNKFRGIVNKNSEKQTTIWEFFVSPFGHQKKHMACREKYKPCILKYKALILKYVPYIFDVCKTLFLRCLEKAIFRGIFGRIFGVRQIRK